MLKTNLVKHFKDRQPNETIEIISKFFNENGYTIKEKEQIVSEIGTWGCVIQLFWEDILLYTQNGKGMTQDYARASGYAELYERFCCGMPILLNPVLLHQLYNNNQEVNNYYYAKDEIQVDYKSLFNEPIIQAAYESLFNGEPQLLEQYFNIYFNHKYIQVPFASLSDNTPLYLNPSLLMHCTGTTGMAAGNTYYEAVNQGLAEIYERYCLYQFLNNFENQTYYELNQENILNKELKSKLQAIKDSDNTIHILDLSYNYNYPVILGIILNHQSKNISITAGSFPIFDIALERVITEIYQNRQSYKDYISDLQIPYKDYNKLDYIHEIAQHGSQNVINENIFTQFKIVDDYNKEQYITKPINNNKDITKWYIEKNDDIYVRDMSLCEDMYAVYIYCKQTSISFNPPLANYNKTYYKQALTNYCLLIKDIKDYLQGNLRISTLIKDINYGYDSCFNLLDYLFNGRCILSPFFPLDMDTRKEIYDFIHNLYNKVPYDDNTIYSLISYWTDYQNDISKYLLLQRYIGNSKYSINEIKQFFIELNQILIDDDFKLFENPNYLLSKMIFNRFKDIYNNHIKDILKGYIR